MKLDAAPQDFIEVSTYIDWDHPEIQALAASLASQVNGEVILAKITFEWVRDNIKHSAEFKLNPITCKASDVLKHRTGYCFAKSHLLAALLRANDIPAALCYQRVCIDNKGATYCLHGLNAVYLKEYGWYRIDPRGNNARVDAQFIPPKEQLAFPLRYNEEFDLPELWKQPLPSIVAVLEKFDHYDDVLKNLPDYDA